MRIEFELDYFDFLKSFQKFFSVLFGGELFLASLFLWLRLLLLIDDLCVVSSVDVKKESFVN